MKRLQTLLMATLLTLALPALSLDAETQAAKDEGMRLWGLSEWIKMQPYLEKAAAEGDVEAMYYLGEANRLLDRGLSKTALDWYLQAAEHGDPHAMLRLYQGGACKLGDYCPADAEGWREKALTEQLPKAEAGDAQAMMALYSIYATLDEKDEAIDWLERSAEADYPEAQDWLGSLTYDGLGFYFTNSGRLEAAEKWVRKAAEQGYVPAMRQLADFLIVQEKYQESWKWLVRASENGHVDSRLAVGWCYLEPSRDVKCQNDPDPILGMAMLLALVHDTNSALFESLIKEYHARLTSSQLAQAKDRSSEWLEKTPPLSNFPPKYGF